MNKIEKALETCEQVLDGIETGRLTTSSSLLQCLRIARLTNDFDATVWLQYEYGGYPRAESGRIVTEAWNIGFLNGRGYIDDGNKCIFTELAAELEEKIAGRQQAINNYSTQGVSVSGEQAILAMRNLTDVVVRATNGLIGNITREQKNLSILRAKYYDYALKKHIELSFSGIATDIFSKYREKVDAYFTTLSKETLFKLQAIEDKLQSDNPESYSQAITTCRRLFENVAVELFEKHFPGYSEKMYKTKSGKEIDVSGDHYLNKLSAVIETLQEKSPSKGIVGSSVLYLVDWIENLSKSQSKGVHTDITKQEAMRCIIHTYICLGDILSLQEGGL